MKSHRRIVADYAPLDLASDGLPFAVGVEAWTAMQNMRNRAGHMELAAGETQYAGNLTGNPKWGIAVVANGIIYMLYVTPEDGSGRGVVVTDGATHTPVGPNDGTWSDWPTGEMTGGIFNGFAIFNQPGDPPWYWDRTLGPGGTKPLPGFLPATQARCIAPFGSHIFAASLSNPTEMLERIAWSDAAPAAAMPATWVPTATNQAGDLILATGAGPVRVMLGLGQQLMVYRATGCYAITYVGRPYIYQARKLSADVGCASCNSVAEVRGSHVLIAPGDLVLTDGTNIRSIGEGRVKESIFGQISEAGMRRSHVYALPGSGEVVFNFAIGQDDGCNLAYVWNYERDKWSIRDQPMLSHSFATFAPDVSVPTTWDNDPGPWQTDAKAWDTAPPGGFAPRAIGLSEYKGAAFLLDEGETHFPGGEPVSGLLERMSLPLGDPDTVKLVHRVLPRLQGTAGAALTVQVGSQITSTDAVTWEEPRPWTIGTTRHVDCLRIGRYLSLRIAGSPGSKWRCSGFAVEYDERARQ